MLPNGLGVQKILPLEFRVRSDCALDVLGKAGSNLTFVSFGSEVLRILISQNIYSFSFQKNWKV